MFLPHDLWCLIVAQLPEESLAVFATVSRFTRALSESEKMWRIKYVQEFGPHKLIYDSYKVQYHADQLLQPGRDLGKRGFDALLADVDYIQKHPQATCGKLDDGDDIDFRSHIVKLNPRRPLSESKERDILILLTWQEHKDNVRYRISVCEWEGIDHLYVHYDHEIYRSFLRNTICVRLRHIVELQKYIQRALAEGYEAIYRGSGPL